MTPHDTEAAPGDARGVRDGSDVGALDPLTVPLEGTQLIEASAGTGKTYTIAFLFLRLIVERDVPVEQILVVTFTRAATAELSDRLRQRLREALSLLDGRQRVAEGDDTLRRWLDGLDDPTEARRRVSEALHGMDAAAISTIHGFCARMLQEFAFESGARLDTDVIDDERPLIWQAVQDYWAATTATAPPPLVRHLVAERLGPDKLLDVAMAAVSDPTVPVLPPIDAAASGSMVDPSVLDALAAWQEAHEAARRAWWHDEGSVKRCLWQALDDGQLDGRVYDKSKVGSWSWHADRLFEEGATGPSRLFDGFDRLCADVLATRTRKGRATPHHPFFDAAQHLREVFESTRAPVASWVNAFRRQLIDDVRERVRQAKERAHAVSYTDLLTRLDRALRHPTLGAELAERIRRRYPAALIDEFQDTDPVQYRIFRQVHGGSEATLFLIGDPKQAIYGFRGADVVAYLRAREATDARWTLTTNYRSDPGVVLALRHLYVGHPVPFADPRIRFVSEVRAREGRVDQLTRPDQRIVEPVRFVFVSRDRTNRRHHSGEIKSRWVYGELPGHVADEVVRLLGASLTIDGRPVRPGDIAVLVRTNRQARELHAALTARMVPAALQGDASVLETPEAADMMALVAALADPSDPAAVRAALATRVMGLGGDELARLRDDEARWEPWLETFARWSMVWAHGSFLQAFRQLVADADVPARLLGQPGGERALTNLLHLGELLQHVAAERRLQRAGLASWLAQVIADPKLVRAELGSDADPIRLESDGGAVKLVTVHRSKGLEYPIVFVPYAGTGLFEPGDVVRFHDDDGQITLDAGSPRIDHHRDRQREEDMSESLRLLYVALTRAIHHVVLFWGAFPGHGTSALGWLLHGHAVERPSVQGVADHLATLGDAALCERLTEIAAGCGGAVAWQPLDERRATPWVAPEPEVPVLAHHVPRRQQFDGWRVGSFSALTGSYEAPSGHDHDAVDALPGAGEGPVVPLAAWPRGAAPGTVLHSVLENLDFRASAEAQQATIDEVLAGAGMASKWAELLGPGLATALTVPLGPGEPALVDLSAEQRLDELGFTFPVRAGATDEVTAEALARCFHEHATAPRVRAYALRVGSLGFAPLRGFLKGYIDLIYVHDGAYGVVDYKSNHLGDTLGDYGDEALGEAMVHHHYILQYHLYLVALHRVLTARLPGYRYEQHVIGARYLFLRGMVPEGGAGHGVYADRPPRALIEALDDLFHGGDDVA